MGFRQEGDGLGYLGVPGSGDLEAFGLAELALEELALDAGLEPVVYAGDLCVRVFDVLGLQEILELLHHGVVDGEVAGDGVVGEVVLAEVEEGVVLVERALEVVRLGWVDLLVRGDAAAAVDGASGVGELDLEVRLVLGVVPWSRT